jgi:hypothetical protein
MSVSQGMHPDAKAVTVADSSASRYRFLNASTASTNIKMKVAIATDATKPVIGILANPTTVADEQAAAVLAEGAEFVLEVDGSGTNIAAGDLLIPSTGGIGVKAAAPSATVQYVGAVALEPSVASGDIIKVQITSQHVTSGV